MSRRLWGGGWGSDCGSGSNNECYGRRPNRPGQVQSAPIGIACGVLGEDNEVNPEEMRWRQVAVT